MKEKITGMFSTRFFNPRRYLLYFSFSVLLFPVRAGSVSSGPLADKVEVPGEKQANLTIAPSGRLLSQQAVRRVTGKVTDTSGESLPGVNIFEKGTTNGGISDMEGNYSIEVPAGSVLVFSFIGFASQEITVTTQTVVNVALAEETLGLDEVVVTAMGIKSEKRKLNFAVQSVNEDDLIAAREPNFVEALEGRIAGLEISSTGGSPNASSQMIIRGISSINPGQDNEPIFILNGMHVSGGASKAAELNPNDIESVTVLKGAAAAALYGQEAANGAIIVTTKSGKEGDVRVELSSTIQFEEAYRLPEIQNTYLRGSQGVYIEESMGGWGPPAPEGTKTYNNAENFLQTGMYQKYDISVSGGTEKFNTYASFNYTDQEGVVPNDYLDRWGALVKSSFKPHEKVDISLMANIVQKESRGFGAGMGSVYNWAIDDDITNYINPDGTIRRPYISSNNIRYSPISPLYSRYEDTARSEANRTLLQATISWDILKSLKVTGRLGYDLTESESHSIVKPRWTMDELYANEAEVPSEPTSQDYDYLGSYFYGDGKSSVMNGGFLATYSVELTPDITLDALAGFDAKREKGRSVSMGGRNFNIPEWESIMNLLDIRNEDVEMSRSEKNIYGYYGELKFDYKGLAQLGVTGRNDHSSTLPKNSRSFFYPSVNGGVIFSELLNIQKPWFNYGKIKGNWAKVGKDAPLYKLNKWYRTLPLPDDGYGIDPTRSSNLNLEPEMTTSWEVGLETRLFGEKTNLEFAYYSTSVENQIVEVRVSPASGNILQTRNEGTITNEGVELVWTQNLVKKGALKWDMITNFGRNHGYVKDLPEGIVELYTAAGRFGGLAATSYLGGSTMALSGTDYLRNPEGKIIVDENGNPKINASPSLLIGNREADFNIGWSNRVTYKKWSLSTLVNIRKGGDVANMTLRTLMGNGQSALWEDYRNREMVIEGVVEQVDGSYVPNATPVIYNQDFHNNYVAPVGSNFVEDGSFIRLGHVTLGYDLTDYVTRTGLKNLRVSVTGRNLFLLTAYRGSDPNTNYTGSSGGAGTIGIDYNNLPNTRSISFNLSATF